MAINQLIPSFNAGELSPYLDARSDLDKYLSGCRFLENFVIMPYGGVYRRPGTEYLGVAKYANKRCRLLGFNFSTTTRFIIEVGNLYMRFWSNGVPVLVDGVPLEVETPYLEAELQDIQFIQINDLMYFVHPLHAPRKLTRLADDNWTFAEVAWDWPAVLDENIDATTIAPYPATVTAWVTATAYNIGDHVTNSGTLYRCLIAHTSAAAFSTDLSANRWVAVTTVNAGTIVTLTASADLFESSHVGSYWQIAHIRDSAYVDQAISSVTTSASLTVLGAWEFTTHGVWTASIQLQRSLDNGLSWEVIRSYKSVADFNASTTGREDKECLLRIKITNYTSNTNARAVLEASEAKDYGIVKITDVTDATHATATVINSLFGVTATKYWSEGAWSTKRGFPRTVSLHEQRIYYAGTTSRPQSIWGSMIDDFENLRVSTNDDGGLFFSLSAQEANPIQWLISQDKLLIGTAGDEWTLGSSSTDSAITPTNVQAKRQSSYGSKYFRALLVNDVALFVQRQGRKVRELVYSFEKDGWIAQDLTQLAEHVTKGEIRECAFAQQPDAIYWTVTGSGQLVGMTYERQQNVVGWHRHRTGERVVNGETVYDAFESVATVYGASGADEIWVAVKREIDGTTVRYIERFKPDFREAFEDEIKPDWWYLDCAKRTVLAPQGTVVTGYDHLEGCVVDILTDGAVSPSKTVTGGVITLQSKAGKVLAGLKYTSQMRPMKLEMQFQDGTTRGKMKRIHELIACVYKSLGGEFSSNGAEWDWLYSRDMSDPMDDSPPVYTGDKQVYVAGDNSMSADVTIRQAQPLPLTILALVPKWDAYGA